jgi:hypothetical protein
MCAYSPGRNPRGIWADRRARRVRRVDLGVDLDDTAELREGRVRYTAQCTPADPGAGTASSPNPASIAKTGGVPVFPSSIMRTLPPESINARSTEAAGPRHADAPSEERTSSRLQPRSDSATLSKP